MPKADDESGKPNHNIFQTIVAIQLAILASLEDGNKRSSTKQSSDQKQDPMSKFAPFLIALLPLYVISAGTKYIHRLNEYAPKLVAIWFFLVVITYLFYARRTPSRTVSGLSTALVASLAVALSICTLVATRSKEYDPANHDYYETHIQTVIRLWFFLFASVVGIILPTARVRAIVNISHRLSLKRGKGLTDVEMADAIKPLRDWLVSFLWLIGLLVLVALTNRYSTHLEDHAGKVGLGVESLSSILNTVTGFVFVTGLIKLSSDNRGAFLKAINKIDENNPDEESPRPSAAALKYSRYWAFYLVIMVAVICTSFILIGWYQNT